MTIASDKLKCSQHRTSFHFKIWETTQIIEAPSEQSYDYHMPIRLIWYLVQWHTLDLDLYLTKTYCYEVITDFLLTRIVVDSRIIAFCAR